MCIPGGPIWARPMAHEGRGGPTHVSNTYRTGGSSGESIGYTCICISIYIHILIHYLMPKHNMCPLKVGTTIWFTCLVR